MIRIIPRVRNGFIAGELVFCEKCIDEFLADLEESGLDYKLHARKITDKNAVCPHCSGERSTIDEEKSIRHWRIEEGLSYRQIAIKLGVNKYAAYKKLEELGLIGEGWER